MSAETECLQGAQAPHHGMAQGEGCDQGEQVRGGDLRGEVCAALTALSNPLRLCAWPFSVPGRCVT